MKVSMKVLLKGFKENDMQKKVFHIGQEKLKDRVENCYCYSIYRK